MPTPASAARLAAADETSAVADDAIGPVADERSFVALCAAFDASGGVARGEDLDRTLRSRGRGASLARMLVSRQALGFTWRATTWLPMAQFDHERLVLRPGFLEVWSALAGDLDGWRVAGWFARRNARLAGRRPADVFQAELPRVVEAARKDRLAPGGP